jgi:hypothetical protein
MQKSSYLPPTSKCSFCTRHPHHNILSMFSGAISLVRSCLMLSMILDEDDDKLLLNCHHQSILHTNNFFFLLYSMFMSIQPEEVIPHLLPANLHYTFNLLDNGWWYHHTWFNVCKLHEQYHCLDLPVSLTISTREHKASSEEAFIIRLTILLLVGPVQV